MILISKIYKKQTYKFTRTLSYRWNSHGPLVKGTKTDYEILTNDFYITKGKTLIKYYLAYEY